MEPDEILSLKTMAEQWTAMFDDVIAPTLASANDSMRNRGIEEPIRARVLPLIYEVLFSGSGDDD